MTDSIPADIFTLARLLADHAQSISCEQSALNIARAILAERDRCAQIAEQTGNFGDYKRDELTTDYGQPRFDMMTEIASAIRNPTTRRAAQ